MLKLFTFLTILTLSSPFSHAGSCSISLEGNTMMQYSSNTIEVDSSCSEFVIKFKNVSTVAKEYGGHNVIVSKDSDFGALTSLVDPTVHSAENGYLPNSNKLIAKSPIIGPNETYDVKIDVSKLNSSEKYVYWCSFTGHWGVMKGNLVMK